MKIRTHTEIIMPQLRYGQHWKPARLKVNEKKKLPCYTKRNTSHHFTLFAGERSEGPSWTDLISRCEIFARCACAAFFTLYFSQLHFNSWWWCSSQLLCVCVNLRLKTKTTPRERQTWIISIVTKKKLEKRERKKETPSKMKRWRWKRIERKKS